jgi:hypothetical protein
MPVLFRLYDAGANLITAPTTVVDLPVHASLTAHIAAAVGADVGMPPSQNHRSYEGFTESSERGRPSPWERGGDRPLAATATRSFTLRTRPPLSSRLDGILLIFRPRLDPSSQRLPRGLFVREATNDPDREWLGFGRFLLQFKGQQLGQ